MTPLVSHLVLVAGLTVAAVADVGIRRIPNAVTVALALCGAAASLADPSAPRLPSALAAFAVVLAAAVAVWRLGLCGGGDAKLAAAAAVWIGLGRLPAYLLATAVAGGLLSLACYALSGSGARRSIRANLLAAAVARAPGAAGARPSAPRVSVPYGVAIAAGALFTVFGGTP